MIAHKDAGDLWSYDNLNHFLLAPKVFTPGTKMAFAGVKDDAERANLIAYLATLSASPKPYPAPAAPDAAAPPAEGAASSSEPVSTESSSAAQ
jgi:cytochrome c